MKTRWMALFLLVVAAVFSRLIPHPWNWTAVGAASLLAGARFERFGFAVAVPVLGLALSDLILGFHSLIFWVYGAFALSAAGAWFFREKMTGWRLPFAALLGSTSFFLITNFAVWLSGGLYPKTMEGLLACYTAALPFWGNHVLGDVVYTPVLFAAWALIEKWALRPVELPA